MSDRIIYISPSYDRLNQTTRVYVSIGPAGAADPGSYYPTAASLERLQRLLAHTPPLFVSINKNGPSVLYNWPAKPAGPLLCDVCWQPLSNDGHCDTCKIHYCDLDQQILAALEKAPAPLLDESICERCGEAYWTAANCPTCGV